ncbi:MAG: DNA-binding protein [Desulfobulbus sp.]|nr:DNA-binding protein [Desulfobulbus sp.]
MKQWFKPIELVDLPCMPSAQQSVSRRAKKEHWMARYSQGQGGGKEYHLSSLPAETQAALHFKYAPPPAKDKELVIREKTDQKLTALKNWQREIFEARVTLYREFEQLQKLHGTNRAVDALVEMARQAELPEHLMRCVAQANARKGEERSLSRSLVLSWQRAVRRYGITALAPKPVEKSEIPEWVPFFMKFYQLPSNPTIPEAMEQMAKILPEGMKIPSYHQVLRWHNKRSNLDREKGRKTGSAYRALKAYRHQDTSNYLPLDECMCDGHTFKGKVANPRSGDPFQPEVCTVVDLATRMVIGWSIGLSESAETVATALRHAVTVNEEKPYGGMIRHFYTDGGSGNEAKVNSDELTGLYARLGMRHTHGIPGNAQARGAIERLNATLWIRAAKELKACATKDMDQLTKRNIYLVMQKELRESGKCKGVLSWPQFREFCQEQVDAYNRRPHSSLPKIRDAETGRIRHMAPCECWAWHLANGWDHKSYLLAEDEIEVMWLPRIERTVRRGQIELFTNTYYNKVLEHFPVGTKVHVAWYQHDPDRVQVWDQEGRMVCYAFWEKNKWEVRPVSKGEQDINARANARRKIKEMDIKRIEAERGGYIDVTAEQRTKAQIVQINPAERKKIEEAKRQLVEKMQQAPKFEVPKDDRSQYRLWKELDERLCGGEALEQEAMLFYEGYRQTASYRAFKKVEDNFKSLEQQG